MLFVKFTSSQARQNCKYKLSEAISCSTCFYSSKDSENNVWRLVCHIGFIKMTNIGGSLLLMTVTSLLLQMRCHTLWQTGTLSSRGEWTCQGYCNNCHLYQGSIMHTVQMCCSYRHKSKAPFIHYKTSIVPSDLSIAFASIKYAKAPTVMYIVEMSCDNWHVKRFRIILTVARVQH